MDSATNGYRIAQDSKYVDEDWWKWWVWIEADDALLDKVSYVIYTLHFSFNDPVRKVDNRGSRFRMETEGWGVFRLYARVHLKDDTELSLQHDLVLNYPDGTQNLK
jgi:transcription initiation factor IIF auxiliary subunit